MSHYRKECQTQIAGLVAAADPGLPIHKLRALLLREAPIVMRNSALSRIWAEETGKAIQQVMNQRREDKDPPRNLFGALNE